MFIFTEKVIRARGVVGVFDMDAATTARVTRDFLAAAQKKGEISGTEALPRSFILSAPPARRAGGARAAQSVYFSSRTPQTAVEKTV